MPRAEEFYCWAIYVKQYAIVMDDDRVGRLLDKMPITFIAFVKC